MDVDRRPQHDPGISKSMTFVGPVRLVMGDGGVPLILSRFIVASKGCQRLALLAIGDIFILIRGVCAPLMAITSRHIGMVTAGRLACSRL